MLKVDLDAKLAEMHARVEIAYTLAGLRGHPGSVHTDDWDLACATVDAASVKRAAASEAEADELHNAALDRVKLGVGLTVAAMKRDKLSKRQRSYFDDHREEILADARLALVDGKLVEVA